VTAWAGLKEDLHVNIECL